MPTIKHRRALKSQWVSQNPVLAAGELGLELDTNRFKFGNGFSTWNELTYFVAEPSVSDNDDFARASLATHAALFSEVKRSRAGRIGTGGKPVVAIRVDHGVDDFLETFWPLMKSRNIPCGIGVMTDVMGKPDNPYEPTKTTWVELYKEHLTGFEVWSHSATHLDPAITGNTIDHEIVGSKRAIETNGFRCQGFQMPGISNTQYDNYSSRWNAQTSWQSDVGQALLSTYGLIQVNGIIGGSRRMLPTDGCYDLGHYTLDGMDWATTKGLLDTAIDGGFSTEWMLHPSFIMKGTVTHTVAHFTAFLDHIVQLRASGTIDIVTPSGLAFADPDTSRRFNPIRDASFEKVQSITTGTQPWAAGGASLPVSINTDGGRTGTNYLHLPASAGYTYVQQGVSVKNTGLEGATMRVEAWVRCVGSATEASIYVTDNRNMVVQRWSNIQPGGDWQRVWSIITIPRDAEVISVRLARRVGSGDLHFDDIQLSPI